MYVAEDAAAEGTAVPVEGSLQEAFLQRKEAPVLLRESQGGLSAVSKPAGWSLKPCSASLEWMLG